ncbi:YgcG family protein, partial [Zoogloea sp.]|uniref:TPM domain-containing protein n=1 Tax=Zoogloea sp. TaxID=49181 RepID=UPI00260232D8
RVEVGRGLEGALPDAIAKRIISDVVTPHFRQGDFAAGVVAGVTALDVRVRGEELPLPAETSGTSAGDDLRSEVGDVFGLALAASFVLGSIFRAIFGRLSGAALVGALVGAGVWLMTGLVAAAGVAGLVAFLSSLLSGGHGRAVNGRGSWPGGRGGSGGGGRGGWSGGGGSFGGGGASGNW